MAVTLIQPVGLISYGPTILKIYNPALLSSPIRAYFALLALKLTASFKKSQLAFLVQEKHIKHLHIRDFSLNNFSFFNVILKKKFFLSGSRQK